jgi:hypothetical protein
VSVGGVVSSAVVSAGGVVSSAVVSAGGAGDELHDQEMATNNKVNTQIFYFI